MSGAPKTYGALLRGIALALCLMTYAGLAYSDDADLEGRLKGIRAGVVKTEAEIFKLKEDFNALLLKRNQLEDSLAKLKKEDESLQGKISDYKEKVRLLIGEVERSQQRVTEQQRKMQVRLRAMYIHSAVSASPVILGNPSQEDVERRILFARKVRDLDARLSKEASEAVRALLDSRAALEQSLAAEEKLREQLKRRREEAEEEGAKLKEVTRQLIEKQRRAQEALALLQGEAKKVEEMIASLTAGEDIADGDTDSEDANSNAEVDSAEVKRDQVGPPSIQKTVLYPNLFDTTLKISTPVTGKVLQTFGRSKLTDFADMVRSKGMEFSTAQGTDVRVVMDGKVVYLGVLPGYEQVLIVEHGARSYSLYGRLGPVQVKQGDEVKREQIVATTGAPDEKGRNFYFEVRQNGVAVNPETILVHNSR